MASSGREDGEGEGEASKFQRESGLGAPAGLREVLDACSFCGAALSRSASPKLLPCLHAVCKSCISKNSEDGNASECSVCGQTFNLSEVTDCHIFEDSVPKCGGCEESALSGWCEQCEEALCSECVLAHQRVKVTRNHTVIPKESPAGYTASLRCTSHRQERLKFFCLICDVLTCRDCQLMNHRGHSFLLLEEAVVPQKEQLQKLLHGIREQKISVKADLLDLDERLHSIKESKATAKESLVNLVHSMHLMLLLRGQQLFKEVQELYEAEEKSLMEMKKTLTGLEKKQEYITAFIQKILSTEGQSILLHKKQILKRVEGLQSQKIRLSDTILQPLLRLNQDLFDICKTFGLVKVNRVPFTSTKKSKNSQSNDAPKEDNSPSGLMFKSVPTPPSESNTAPDQSQSGESGSASSKPVVAQPTQMSSDSALPLVGLRNHVQSIMPSVSHAGAPPYCASDQAPQSKTAQSIPAEVSHALLQSATSHSVCPQPSQSKRFIRSLSLSYPHTSKSHPSLTGKSVLKTYINLPVKYSKAKSKPAQPLRPKHGNTPASASHLSFTSSMAHHSASLHTASSLSSNSCGTGPTQVPPLTLNYPGSHSDPSSSTQLFSTQFGQIVSNLQSQIMIGHMQQSLPLSQAISINPAPSQPSHLNWPPVCQAPSTSAATTVVLQRSPAIVQSNPLLFSLLQDSNALQLNTPVIAVNQIPVLHQPALYLTAPASVPVVAVAATGNSTSNVTIATSSGENEKSRHPVSGEVSCPPLSTAPRITALPGSSNNELINAVSSKPPAQTPFTSNNPGQSDCAQKPQCELPVQAPADSVCDRDISTQTRASPADEEPDDNLPTSTVSETDTKELSSVQEKGLRLSPSPDLISSVSVSACAPNKSFLSLPKSQLDSSRIMSLTESTSTSKHWSVGMPTSLRQILEHTDAPASNVDGVVSEDAVPTSELEHESLPEVMQEDDDEEEEEETDISDSELVRGEDAAVILQRDIELTELSNRSLCISLLRLPISLPASGSPLPQFHIVSYNQTDGILLQEIQEGQPMQRRLRIPAPPGAAVLSQSSAPDFPQLNDVLDCAVCLSAGATLICAECARSFHTQCHVPPVLFRPFEVWVCSLCQDIVDDTDPFSRDRLKEPYLSLQDQRRCEQLLLTLMCEENSYLLYDRTEFTAECMEFHFIRGRLLGKRRPPYRSAAELVSDLWTLFNSLSAKSKNRELVVKLQNSFQERLNLAFGESLHASLLRPTGSEELKGAPETELEKDKLTRTLKRMREYFTANGATVAKKPCTESSSEAPQDNED